MNDPASFFWEKIMPLIITLIIICSILSILLFAVWETIRRKMIIKRRKEVIERWRRMKKFTKKRKNKEKQQALLFKMANIRKIKK